jgi:hypothetical protein
MSTMTTNKRWLLWLPLLGIALWLGLFADKTPNDKIAQPKPAAVVPQKTATPTTIPRPVAKTDAPQLETLVDRATLMGSEELAQKSEPKFKSKLSKERNLFASSSWTPPAPPSKPTPPIATPAPTAPAFPFQYVGKKLEDSVWEVYLSRGDQNFLVREGGTLENTYRIDSITPQRISVTYLPLGQSQSLSIGESQ